MFTVNNNDEQCLDRAHLNISEECLDGAPRFSQSDCGPCQNMKNARVNVRGSANQDVATH